MRRINCAKAFSVGFMPAARLSGGSRAGGGGEELRDRHDAGRHRTGSRREAGEVTIREGERCLGNGRNAHSARQQAYDRPGVGSDAHIRTGKDVFDHRNGRERAYRLEGARYAGGGDIDATWGNNGLADSTSAIGARARYR